MFFRRMLVVIVMSVAGLVACGSDGGSGSPAASVTWVTGGLAGVSFTPKDLLVWVYDGGDAVEVYFSDLPGSCDFFRAHPYATRAAHENLFDLFVPHNGGAPGTHPITVGGAQSWYLEHDAQCVPLADVQATSGTITIATRTDAFVTGSFEVTFGSFGTMKGTFNAPVCPPAPSGTPIQKHDCVP